MDSTRVAIEYDYTLQGDRPVVVANPGRAKDAKVAADYDYFVPLLRCLGSVPVMVEPVLGPAFFCESSVMESK